LGIVKEDARNSIDKNLYIRVVNNYLQMNYRRRVIDLLGGLKISKELKFVSESQYWSKDKQKDYQQERLKSLIIHAYNNVPYYTAIFNELKLKPYDINCINDLQKLPVLTKEIIKKNFSRLQAIDNKKFFPQLRKTGGTTGVPLIHYSDAKSWNLHWALKYRAWSWGGYSNGDPIGVLGGSSIIPDKKIGLKRYVWNKLNNFYPLSASSVSDVKLLEFVNTIDRKGIKTLRGYPSSIANFAEYCINNNKKVKINLVITTAEVLRPEYKELIIQAFNCTIIDSYGCADGGGSANTCELSHGFHISIEASIWEVCDVHGDIVPEGVKGELTLTSLTNYAMPFIRYQPGDTIENTFNYKRCSCGRTAPRINKIEGRSTDILKFGNGKSLGGPALTLLFREFPLRKYQIVQNNINILVVNIIIDEGYTEQTRKNIREILEFHCGIGVRVTVNEVKEIPISESGKFRFIISNI
jgi:phenylacetate-CoA ligase